MEKITILNRKQQKIIALLEQPASPKGLAFVMHGLGGFKEQPQMQTFAQACLEQNYTVVRFDTTNTLGESDGDYADATTTNYYEDLEDVINWSSTQSWYTEPFILVGHSLGSMCLALYAEKNPKKVKALAPLSTVVSGQISWDTKAASGEFEQWQKTGWRIEMSDSKPGVEKRLKWSHMEDRLKYDILPGANKLAMPVLLIVGELDDMTLPKNQQELFNRLPGKKELHIIKGASHTFKNPEQLKEIGKIIGKWLEKID